MIVVMPPMYGRNASGIDTEPSACWCISRIGIRIRGLAETVLFSEYAKTVFFVSGSRYRRFRRRHS